MKTDGIALLAALLFCACAEEPVIAPKTETPGSDTIAAAVTYDALYVVSGAERSIAVIDAAAGTVVDTIHLKNVEFPHHISLSPDRRYLAVAAPGVDLSAGHAGHNHGSGDVNGAIMILDAATGRTLASQRLRGMNHNAAFAPDGSEVWTAVAESPGKVTGYDFENNALFQQASVTVENAPLEVSFANNGRYAFATNNGSNSVSVIDRAKGTVVKTIPTGAGPVGAWPGRDGRIYVDNETEKTLTVIDTATLEVERTIDVGVTPAMVAVAPDGNLWVTSGTGGGVVVMTPIGSRLNLVATGAGAHGIVFSGDGKTVYVTNQDAGTVSAIDVATYTVVRTIPVPRGPNGIIWRAK